MSTVSVGYLSTTSEIFLSDVIFLLLNSQLVSYGNNVYHEKNTTINWYELLITEPHRIMIIFNILYYVDAILIELALVYPVTLFFWAILANVVGKPSKYDIWMNTHLCVFERMRTIYNFQPTFLMSVDCACLQYVFEWTIPDAWHFPSYNPHRIRSESKRGTPKTLFKSHFDQAKTNPAHFNNLMCRNKYLFGQS